MGDPRRLRPDEVEIVVARELRKAGVPLATLRVTARHGAVPNVPDAFVLELAGVASVGGPEAANRPVLVELRNESAVVGLDAVQALGARSPASREDDGPKRLQAVHAVDAGDSPRAMRVLVSTTGFEAAAVVGAKALGVVLLRITDGGAAFLRSQWAMGEQPPAWVPEYMTELVDLGPAGDVRYELITGRVDALSSFRAEARSAGGEE